MGGELTVETALAELEQMFPNYLVSITASSFEGKQVWTVLAGYAFKGETLSVAMSEARAWKHSQQA